MSPHPSHLPPATCHLSPPSGRVLIIAGSDSGGGAGIQGDLKTVQALGGYGMTAITALTAQNTLGVFGIHPVPEEFIAQQIRLCLEDIGADAIKTGMLHSAAVIEVVAHTLMPSPETRRSVSTSPKGEVTPRHDRATLSTPEAGIRSDAGAPLPRERSESSFTIPGEGYPLVVDPVMVAKGGSPLLEASALHALKTLLIPRATLITPNLPEAELLLGRTIDEAKMEDAARALLDLGSQAVLLKGGHGSGTVLRDVLVTRHLPPVTFSTPRLATRHTHGTGCTFASAIATGLAQKIPLDESVTRAHAYVQAAIARAPGFGAGNGPLGH